MRRPTSCFETLKRDMSYGLRTLARDWRFTTAAVLILGLGIGANTAIFSLVDAVLFRHASLAASDPPATTARSTSGS
jgi:hypothetical protein